MHNLNDAEPAFIARLSDLCGYDIARPDTKLDDPRGRSKGRGAVVAPRSTQDVARIVDACHEARVGIVPLGGSTGLVLGQIMDNGPLPLILSLERMTQIRAVLPDENIMIVEAGCILKTVQDEAERVGRLFPLSLASEGSARIGGLLATNAGGVNVLRYGNARALVTGLEAVTPDGKIWHGLSRLYKDNTGYDLRDLFIGSEGSLGVITAAALRLSPRPAGMAAAMLAVPSPRAALDLLGMARDMFGDVISAFELISGQGFRFLEEAGIAVKPPFATSPDWCVLIDLGLPRAAAEGESLLQDLFSKGFEAGLITDGVMAISDAQRQSFWHIREHIPSANRTIGAISSHDISIPLSEVPAFITRADALMAGFSDVRVNCFGHLGDGNLHYNIFPAAGKTRADYADTRDLIKRTVHDLVHDLSGSVSAEHGVGRLKVDDLERYGDPQKLALMRAIKAAIDPKGIMNPGAVLR